MQGTIWQTFRDRFYKVAIQARDLDNIGRHSSCGRPWSKSIPEAYSFWQIITTVWAIPYSGESAVSMSNRLRIAQLAKEELNPLGAGFIGKTLLISVGMATDRHI
jgi:hypothetical protein